MTIPLLPALAGLTFPVKKSALFPSVIEHTSVAGTSTTQNPQPFPVYNYDLPYSFLRADSVNLEIQTMQAFFEERQGPNSPFHFLDPFDSAVTDQNIGTGDGTTTDFGFVRTMQTSTIPVQDADPASVVVKVDGVTQALGTDYSLLSTIQYQTCYGIRFAGGHIPAAGKVVTATFNYWWLCRFNMTAAEFSQFVELIWEMPSLKFKSVKQ